MEKSSVYTLGRIDYLGVDGEIFRVELAIVLKGPQVHTVEVLVECQRAEAELVIGYPYINGRFWNFFSDFLLHRLWWSFLFFWLLTSPNRDNEQGDNDEWSELLQLELIFSLSYRINPALASFCRSMTDVG